MSESCIPTGIDVNELSSLIRELSGEASYLQRIDHVSARFVGRPYLANTLIGGPDTDEVFTATLEGFDCVTYIETVLAISLSNSVEEFRRNLREMRYEDSEIDWRKRNHYMLGWAMSNERGGLIANITRGPETKEKSRVADVVEGLRPVTFKFRYFPKSVYPKIRSRIESGDLVLFVSTRKRLDVFHTGFLFVKDDQVVMRHATRAAGCVIEQPLTEFLKNNRMAGFIILRPLCPH